MREQRKGVEEHLLPGLDFNNNQLFFINFAQVPALQQTTGIALDLHRLCAGTGTEINNLVLLRRLCTVTDTLVDF